MCGRARLSSDVSEIKIAFGIPPERPMPNFAASWNVAPTDPLPIVRYDAKDHRRSLQVMRWGLVPFWVKDLKAGFANINAKTDGVWGFLHDPSHVMLGMRGVISSTRSCQVLTSAASAIPSDKHAASFPPLHDQDARSYAFSRQPLRKRHSTCSNRSLYDRASLPGYDGVHSDRTSMPSRPLSTTQAMLPVVTDGVSLLQTTSMYRTL